jgi:hypothetical protein
MMHREAQRPTWNVKLFWVSDNNLLVREDSD